MNKNNNNNDLKDTDYYKNIISSYNNIIKQYEELMLKLDKEKDNLYIETLDLKNKNDMYKNYIIKRLKNAIKDIFNIDVEIILFEINMIHIKYNDCIIVLDEAGGSEYYIYDKTFKIYEDICGLIIDNSDKISIESDAYKVYQIKNDLFSLLKEYILNHSF